MWPSYKSQFRPIYYNYNHENQATIYTIMLHVPGRIIVQVWLQNAETSTSRGI